MKTLTKKEIANFFGTSEDNLGPHFESLYQNLDMRYRVIEGKEKEDLILDILNKIENDKQIIGAPERTNIWFNGWNENLQDFLSSKDSESIVPKFIRPNNVVRLGGQFIEPYNTFFERDYAKLLQCFVYNKYISKDIKNVYEFGCGSGFNLINLSSMKSDINLYGSDFVKSSVDLINEMGDHYGLSMKSELFNMLEPNYDYQIKENSCVFTHGAIEQLAGNFKNFINYLIQKKPKVCFHLEPTVEVYEDDNLFDYLQIKFHLKRGYSTGLLPYLKKLEKEGKIENLYFKRINFGSKFMEGYTLMSWSPK
tara:strand:- start:415 stop:1341 length:927 start_codon:yes stop_codon:yes gene_type:complete